MTFALVHTNYSLPEWQASTSKMWWNSRFIVVLWAAHHIKHGVSPCLSKMETPVLQRVTVVFVSVKWLLKYWLFHVMLQERQVALIRELLSDKDTMSRLNDNERQTLMQLSQCHHDDMTSPRKRYESLKSNTYEMQQLSQNVFLQ